MYFMNILDIYNISLYYIPIRSTGAWEQVRFRQVIMNVSAEELVYQEKDIEQAARSLKAMSHPLRLKILCVLGQREISVQDIVCNVGTSQSNISQHLAILRDKGILDCRKDANRVFYRVGDERTLKLIEMMQQVFCSAKHS